MLNGWREQRDEREVIVTADDIMHMVSKWTGVPLNRMEQKEAQKLLKMEEELKRASHWPRRGGDCHQQGVRGWELPIRAAQEKAASADSNRAEGPLPSPHARGRSSIEMVIHR
jgi:hypothetical protein